MKITAAAKLSGINSKTIRYYEEVGLLPPTSRNANGYREYAEADIERLIFIRRCRELHIPIKELMVLVNVQIDQQSPCLEVDDIILTQLEKVRERITELLQLEKTLNELAHSCQFDTVSQCQILQKLKQK
ncbi:MerR family transcriptional regulator [Shewanella sp. OMA3-2]|uniref:MerR family transcriptional regulator n=1 Tax=Shewanella sp. OMA3-2 TaxID=2908650 RepID=UPI001F327EBE|nr:MerR family transcriptional regulator [Shewanella sp. OMA3-2]UJF21820.1 MerR family transcriptional regulator [Shewanella sp. OMA3-2]